MPSPATCLALILSDLRRLRPQVSGKDLTYNAVKVFLNGCNIAWNNYGYDFGNGGYDGTLEQWLREIAESGGNSIRKCGSARGSETRMCVFASLVRDWLHLREMRKETEIDVFSFPSQPFRFVRRETI